MNATIANDDPGIQSMSLMLGPCAMCGTRAIPCASDIHPKHGDTIFTVPKYMRVEEPPYRWYGKVVAVYCSAECGHNDYAKRRT